MGRLEEKLNILLTKVTGSQKARGGGG
jgi:hypothetical protein